MKHRWYVLAILSFYAGYILKKNKTKPYKTNYNYNENKIFRGFISIFG